MMQKSLAKDEGVLNFFVNDKALISGAVTSIHIYKVESTLMIDLDVRLLYVKVDKDCRIRFIDVIEFYFNHTNGYDFYDIPDLKFFKVENGYYISFDPDTVIRSRSDTDNNLILSKSIEAFSLTI